MAPRYLTHHYLSQIHQLYNRGDWKSLLEQHKIGGEEERSLLWPTPDLEDLEFIVESVKACDKNCIVSIGCGTGLLEWFIMQATGMYVMGVEVDRRYWSQARCKNKLFLEAIYPEDEIFEEVTTSDQAALMFCYFNNGPAFQSYLKKYRGDTLVIIGPHNAGRHTDPGPFDSSLTHDWTLFKSKEIGNTKDFIAIYHKKKLIFYRIK